MIDDILKRCESTGSFLGESPLGVNDVNIFGDTPLHLASRWGDIEGVAALLAAGANVNATGERGQTPLFCTSSIEVVDLLVAAGADAAVKDESGKTAERFLRNVGQTKVANHIGFKTRRS